MRGRAFVRVCVCACMRDCHSSSLARHAPLLLSSSTRASTLPLILEMRSSSPGPQYASLVLLCLTRPSCRAPFLLCDRAVQRLCAGDLSLARVRRTRPRGRPGRGGRSTSTRSQVRDLCACARARACVRACVRATRATLATSGDGPAQPGRADAAVATPLSSPPPLLVTGT